MQQRLKSAETLGKMKPFIRAFNDFMRDVEKAGIKVIPQLTTMTKIVNGIVIQDLLNVQYTFSMMSPEEKKACEANRSRIDREEAQQKEKLDKAREKEGK